MKRVITLLLLLSLVPLAFAAGDNIRLTASDGVTTINGTDICVDVTGTPSCLSDAVVGAGDITAVNAIGPFILGGGTSGAVNIDFNDTLLNLTIQQFVTAASNPFDQVLNTTSGVTFQNLTITDNITASWFIGSVSWNDITEKFAGSTTDELTEGSTNLYDNQSWNAQSASVDFVNITGDTMTGDLNFSKASINNVSHIQFNVSGDGCVDEFCMEVNPDLDTLDVSMPGGNVVQQIGFEFFAGGKRVRNDDVMTLDDCSAVYLSGATGNIPEVKQSGINKGFRIAQATVGLTTESIASSSRGYVTSKGVVRNCNTTGMIEGLSVFLGVDGSFTQTIPSAPNATCFLGTVIKASETEGEIDVNVLCLPLVEDLSDVDPTSKLLSDNSLLQWDNSSEKWVITENITVKNISVGGSVDLDGTSMRPLDEKNAAIAGPAVGLYMTGPSGQNLPHMIVQSGGEGQASVILRSMMIVNEIAGFHNTTNATSCQAYMDNVSEELKIDCNTSASGADLLVGDDLQVDDEVWVKKSDGSWKFLTRTLTLMDNVMSNLVLGNLNHSLNFADYNFSFNESAGDTIIINIDSNETITEKLTDSVILSEGTNETPKNNFVYYTDKTNPTLTTAESAPTGDVAEVARIILGESYVYGSVVDQQSEKNAISNIYKRFFDDGPRYVSGYSQDASTTNINFSTGLINIITHEDTSTSVLDSDDGFFWVYDNGTYEQATDFSDIAEYATGEVIGNNKYFNVVFGVVHNDIGENRMVAIVQSGTTEYITLSGAELDSSNLANFFPASTELKSLYVPIARVVMQRSAGVNTIQTLSNGGLYIDIRGVISSAGGAAASPPITDHAQLTSLDYASAGHTGFLAADGSTPLTATWAAGQEINATWFNGLFNFTTVSTYLTFNGHTLTLDDSALNTAFNQTTAIESVNTTANIQQLVNDTYLQVSDLNNMTGNITYASTNSIGDNTTCIKIKGSTSLLEIC